MIVNQDKVFQIENILDQKERKTDVLSCEMAGLATYISWTYRIPCIIK